MKLHTVFITHNRLELTKRAIESYLETVTVPFTAIVEDNGSDEEMTAWLLENYDPAWPRENEGWGLHLLGENKYPGWATNNGWSVAPDDATHLQRADNDFEFLPDWCEEVQRIFQSKRMGQVGLRTSSQECPPGRIAPKNVGGNCVIRRRLWDRGLRWDERTWPEICEDLGTGYSEDAILSAAVKKMGYKWARVKMPCIRQLGEKDANDEYYVKSLGDRGLVL